MITNAKTMFKIMNEFKKGDNKIVNKKVNAVNKEVNQNISQEKNNNYQEEITRQVFFA